MKNATIQDERVLLEKRKISSHAFGIVYFGLLLSILLQQFVFHAPFSQYAAEFIIFMVSAVYVVIRNILVGNSIFGEKYQGHHMVIINSLVCGFTISAITTSLNTAQFGLDQMGGLTGIMITGTFTFVSGTLISFAGFKVLHVLNLKRQKQLEEGYLDEE